MKTQTRNRKLALAALLLAMLVLTPAAMATTISTNKADYAPDEVVTISGSGFNTGTLITVGIVAPDGWLGPEDGQTDVDIFDSMDVLPWVSPWEPVGSDGFTFD